MKLTRTLLHSCTTQEIIAACESAVSAGHDVAIKHIGDRIEIWDESIDSDDIAKLKLYFSHLVHDAPAQDAPHYSEYEAELLRTEAELRAAGVEL